MNEKKTTDQNKKGASARIWVLLHILLAVYALSGVFSKLAAGERVLSCRFCLFYGLLLLLLGVYAIGWQQIIKRMPLTKAFANKAVSVIWACIYGMIFFHETITVGKAVGGLLTIAGVILFAFSDKQTDPEPAEKLQESAKSTTSVKNKITGDTNETAAPDSDREGM